ncbi:MAG TPA: type II secretion system protein [Burkholderiales bacterium]|nr:type II secretion system protein [Burkholderiales bacterium]
MRTGSDRRRCGGYTYVFALVLIALVGVGLAATGELWHTAMKRERERELLFVGGQMQRALTMYYQSSPGVRRYPASLEALLEDRRYPNVRRYLRRIYIDPVTGSAQWGLVKRPDGGIIGVHSLSRERPLKTGGFSPGNEQFTGKTKYSEWVFKAEGDEALAPFGSGNHTIDAWQPLRTRDFLTPLTGRGTTTSGAGATIKPR